MWALCPHSKSQVGFLPPGSPWYHIPGGIPVHLGNKKKQEKEEGVEVPIHPSFNYTLCIHTRQTCHHVPFLALLSCLPGCRSLAWKATMIQATFKWFGFALFSCTGGGGCPNISGLLVLCSPRLVLCDRHDDISI